MDLVVVVLVGLGILIGLIGIVVPVLPGSLLIAGSVAAWAIYRGTAGAWWVFAAVSILLIAASVLNYVVAGRKVIAIGVPKRSLIVAGLAGILGFFLVPVVGLFLFFPAGLFAMEYLRVKDVDAARTSAWEALKATGLGMLIELTLAFTAATVWLVAAVTAVSLAGVSGP